MSTSSASSSVPNGAEHQGVGFLYEEQLAQEEEVKRQQMLAALHGGVGVLLERQGDVEAQAVLASGALVGGSHDAAAGAGDDHQVVARQGRAQLAGQGVNRVLHWRARRAEDRDLAPALELLQGAEGVLHLAQGLQHDLGIPAVAVGLGHADHGGEHVAVQRQVGAVARGGEGEQLVHFAGQVDATGLEVA